MVSVPHCVLIFDDAPPVGRAHIQTRADMENSEGRHHTRSLATQRHARILMYITYIISNTFMYIYLSIYIYILCIYIYVYIYIHIHYIYIYIDIFIHVYIYNMV